MVLDVPEHPQPPVPRPRPAIPRRPVDAVLFDFHGTLAQVEHSPDWMLHATRACGVDLDRAGAAALAERLVAAGFGGPLPERVPEHLAEAFADRDLSAAAHRAAYTGLAATVTAGMEGLAEALYERLLCPDGWTAYPAAIPTLRALRAARVPVAVVSNIGFDIRPLLRGLGLADLVDATVLSYEVGACKPDPEIFRYACAMVGVEPGRSLMVGDTTADAAAVHAGCSALIIPARGPGQVNGLAAVLDLVGRDGDHVL
jgi:HAD superfamily hydrolase (TIGR01509 family)